MSVYASDECVCVYFDKLVNAYPVQPLVSVWEQTRSMINILLLMKDTIISPHETAQGGCAQGKHHISSQCCEDDEAPTERQQHDTLLPSFGTVKSI